ncbi:MAG: hypothetical protein RBU21_18520 [FCB group bacterium]|jgi:hypothetical protein|nr:hypothetical protein [FCB group bacterium]
MVHMTRITLAKACTEEDGGETEGLSLEQLQALLGGTVEEVLLSVVTAKGKGSPEA